MKQKMLMVTLVASMVICGESYGNDLLGRMLGRAGCCDSGQSCCDTPATDCCGRRKLLDINLHISIGAPNVRGLFPLFRNGRGGCCETVNDCCDSGRTRMFRRGFGGNCGCDSNCGQVDHCDPCATRSRFRGMFRGMFDGVRCNGCQSDCGNDCGTADCGCDDGCSGGLLRGGRLRGLFHRGHGCGCDTGCETADPCANDCGGCGTRKRLFKMKTVCLRVPSLGLMDRVRGMGRRCGCDNGCDSGCGNNDCGCQGSATPAPQTEGAEPAKEESKQPAVDPVPANTGVSVPIVDPSAFVAPRSKLVVGRN